MQLQRLKNLVFFFVCNFILTGCAHHMSYNDWLIDFKKNAAKQGIHQDLLDTAFKGSAPLEKVLELDRKQPEKIESFTQYLEKRLTPKLPIARAKLSAHRKDLIGIQRKYKVPANVIVALWGMETHFGSNIGNFFIINALATLAYDGRRRELFEKELIEALKIVQNEGVPLEKLQGSWAGALGQAQFMPSVFNEHAVDESHVGFKDIWGNYLNVFASIANYLANLGWRENEPWGYEVKLPPSFNKSLISPTPDRTFIKKTTKEWEALGVARKGNKPFRYNLEGAIIIPDKSQQAFLVHNNFFVIFKWNRSFNFALTVLLLSNKVSKSG